MTHNVLSLVLAVVVIVVAIFATVSIITNGNDLAVYFCLIALALAVAVHTRR